MVKTRPANAGVSGDLGLISGLGRSPGGGKGYPLQYSGLENSLDCTVHGVAKSQTQLSGFHFMSLQTHKQFLYIDLYITTLLNLLITSSNT